VKFAQNRKEKKAPGLKFRKITSGATQLNGRGEYLEKNAERRRVSCRGEKIETSKKEMLKLVKKGGGKRG